MWCSIGVRDKGGRIWCSLRHLTHPARRVEGKVDTHNSRGRITCLPGLPWACQHSPRCHIVLACRGDPMQTARGGSRRGRMGRHPAVGHLAGCCAASKLGQPTPGPGLQQGSTREVTCRRAPAGCRRAAGSRPRSGGWAAPLHQGAKAAQRHPISDAYSCGIRRDALVALRLLAAFCRGGYCVPRLLPAGTHA